MRAVVIRQIVKSSENVSFSDAILKLYFYYSGQANTMHLIAKSFKHPLHLMKFQVKEEKKVAFFLTDVLLRNF